MSNKLWENMVWIEWLGRVTTFLGVSLDCGLDWSEQFGKIKSKLAK
jgi:hypothetical protein